ncbi:MAG TPA: hypothetical protein VL527_02015 [Dongiaceae bacterium]|jgi:hypothetical protein|nr:hypothetical protein [Dongiaceae bacterium]
MLTRISLIVAIVAGLLVAGLNFSMLRGKITTLADERTSERTQKEAAQTELTSTKKNLDSTKKELDSTKTELTSTQAERDKAVSEADTQSKRATKLAADLSKTTQEKNDAQAELAQWKASGITADQVKPLLANLKDTQTQLDSMVETNKALDYRIAWLTNRLARYEEPNHVVKLPDNLMGKVLVADPKWDFVVLNVGAKQGALEDGIMLVNRDGRLVAKVQIRSVQANRCIANVLPNWKLGDVMEGDEVIP